MLQLPAEQLTLSLEAIALALRATLECSPEDLRVQLGWAARELERLGVEARNLSEEPAQWPELSDS